MLRRARHFCYRSTRFAARKLRITFSRQASLADGIIGWLEKPTFGAKSRLLMWQDLGIWGGLGRNGQNKCLIPPDEVNATLEVAEKTCAHEFNLLGSGPVCLGEKIDWHKDFKSGYRWDPSLHYSKIRQVEIPSGADIKVPWELSRCMHFISLGMADALSNNPMYFKEWKAQTQDWIDANPNGYGVNWVCAMDVALRSVNWLVGLSFFAPRLLLENEAHYLDCLNASLWNHGLHLMRNLEWDGPFGNIGGNHFLADLLGLLALGAFFRDTPRGIRWWKFSKKQIDLEMFRQVNNDGTHQENSTSYHRLVLEMFLLSETLAHALGDPFEPRFVERLVKMKEFVAAYTSPSGKAVQFGDNDSGRVLSSLIGDETDHRYLFTENCGFGGRSNRFLLQGKRDCLSTPSQITARAWSFDQGGYFFLKSGNMWIGLRCGSIRPPGGHAHCDQLSLVLNCNGQDVFVDRGTGVYSPDILQRNRFRSTSCHNVLQLNGQEQNEFSSNKSGLFRMRDCTHAHSEGWQFDGQTYWEGIHSGFVTPSRPDSFCQRKVFVQSGKLKFADSLQSLQADDKLEWFFHLAPGLNARLLQNSAEISLGSNKLFLEWDFSAVAKVICDSHSPRYGVVQGAQTIGLHASRNHKNLSSYAFSVYTG